MVCTVDAQWGTGTKLMRINCEHPEFADSWVEVSERWTLAEWDELNNSADWQSLMSIFAEKVEACHVQCGDKFIDSPDGITEDAINECDLVIVGFLGRVLQTACGHLVTLGNMSARPSLNGSEKMVAR